MAHQIYTGAIVHGAKCVDEHRKYDNELDESPILRERAEVMQHLYRERHKKACMQRKWETLT
jgi:hypothetical protein